MDNMKLLYTLLVLLGVVYGAKLNRLFPDLEEAPPKEILIMKETRPNRNTVCFGVLGCFSNSGVFHDFLRRPIQPLPQSPSSIRTMFTLLTRDNKHPVSLKSWDQESIEMSNFTATRKTKFIIHGYLNNQHSPWVFNLAKTLLDQDDYNVIVVDWIFGSVNLYPQSAVDTRVVGAEVWYLCAKLTALMGMKNEDVHLIGHSLGAHIAGYAGERMKKLARISGLDPAQPYFEGTDPKVRLDPTDAVFVDVIHTDGSHFITKLLIGGFGMIQPCGHVDFYPNGGRDQPACDAEDALDRGIVVGLLAGVRHFVTCNHMRAVYLFTESIKQSNETCQYTSFPCPDYETFANGACGYCGKRCTQMGFYADQMDPTFRAKINNFYYLKTSGVYSRGFCMRNYIVIIKTRRDMVSAKGEIFLRIDGGPFRSVTEKSVLIKMHQAFVVTTREIITKGSKLELRWMPEHSWLGWGILGRSGNEKLELDIVFIDGPQMKANAFKGVTIGPKGTVKTLLTNVETMSSV